MRAVKSRSDCARRRFDVDAERRLLRRVACDLSVAASDVEEEEVVLVVDVDEDDEPCHFPVAQRDIALSTTVDITPKGPYPDEDEEDEDEDPSDKETRSSCGHWGGEVGVASIAKGGGGPPR